jgi:hypothetical protein
VRARRHVGTRLRLVVTRERLVGTRERLVGRQSTSGIWRALAHADGLRAVGVCLRGSGRIHRRGGADGRAAGRRSRG